MKKKQIISIILLVSMLVMSLASCSGDNGSTSDGDDEGTSIITEYKTGEQIELYLNSSNSKSVFDFIDANPDSTVIADENVVELNNGVLIPKKQGITYISCQYGTVIKNYNIIVHNGAEQVTSWQIDGNTTSEFTGYVGKTYKLSTTNSSSCDFSELRVTATTNYPTVIAEDLIAIENDGTLKIVGVGVCEVWIRSATNVLDTGVRIQITSSIENETLDMAIDNWIADNIELQQSEVITKDELAEIQSLTFLELISFEETEWKSILPSLSSITFDLTNGCDYSSTYGISAGNLEYRFIGSQDKEYAFSLYSAERASLNLKFEDIVLNSKNAISLDTSNVENTSVDFAGICKLKGADASGGTNSYKGVVSKNLSVTLQQNSNVTILGGNGIDSSTSTRTGSTGMFINGDLDIISISSSEETLFNVYGGNGGNGSVSGATGGDGGIGIEAYKINFDGVMIATVTGGKGGNGAKGIDGVKGSPSYSGHSDREAVWDGADGGDGTDGKDGSDAGVGGYAYDTKSILLNGSKVTATGGAGGNGGNGGNGGAGGKGQESGGWGSTAGDGGDGGDGGNGGNAYITRSSSGNEEVVINSGNLSLIDGAAGTVGKGGSYGAAGAKGMHCDNDNCGQLLTGGNDGTNGTRGSAGTDGRIINIQ